MDRNLDKLAKKMNAFVESDGGGFRRAARILQSIWRERSGFPMGDHNGSPLGSRLPVEFAEQSLANYITPNIKKVVRSVLDNATESQLFSKPRIFNNLLSSQPLSFNLFGEMKLDYQLATELFNILGMGSIQNVTNIDFEFSPDRSSERFTNDKSAFDAFIEYDIRGGGKGFLGVEVKYHENLTEPAAPHRPDYDRIATKMNCFDQEKIAHLQSTPLQQFWRNHLLAGSMLLDPYLKYSEGIFVVVSPAANPFCQTAIRSYRRLLRDQSTFDAWSLEDIINVLSMLTQDAWVEELRHRYIDFNQLQ